MMKTKLILPILIILIHAFDVYGINGRTSTENTILVTGTNITNIESTFITERGTRGWGLTNYTMSIKKDDEFIFKVSQSTITKTVLSNMCTAESGTRIDGEISEKIVVKLPSWNNFANVSSDQQAKWRRFYTYVNSHEEEHVTVFSRYSQQKLATFRTNALALRPRAIYSAGDDVATKLQEKLDEKVIDLHTEYMNAAETLSDEVDVGVTFRHPREF